MQQMSGQTRGLVMAALSAGSLGLVTVSVRIAYDSGMGPLTLVAFRVAVAVLGIGLMVVLMRRSLRLPHDIRWAAVGVTVGTMMIAYGYMVSVFFISVSLAALIFYLYPVMVLIVTTVTSKKLPAPVTVTAFLMAFGGLAMALGPSLETLDWRGVAFALTAAAGATLLIIASTKAARGMDPVPLAFYSQIWALPVVAAGVIIGGGPEFPGAASGWCGLGVASGAYLSGIILQLVAVRTADPAHVALIFNLEPLVTLILAAVVLGERLQGVQYLGGVLVLGGILLAGWVSARD